MQRYDVIQRLIQQLAETLARIAGMRREGRAEEALVVVAQTYHGLGVDPEALRRLDSRSLALLHGSPLKLRAIAELCEAEAELMDALGRPEAAEAKRRRALELHLEADFAEPGRQRSASVVRLIQSVDADELPGRYRHLVRE
jgi:hypothetical protein